MVATLCDVKLEEVVPDAAELKTLSAGNGAFTLPALHTEEGEVISQTPAILEYLAFNNDLLGKSEFEKAQVAQWMSILRTETWPLTKSLAAMVFGQIPCDAAEHTFLYNKMKDHIKVLNNSLKGR